MTKKLLLSAAATAALMISVPAFAQGAGPTPEAFPPYDSYTSSPPVAGRIVMQSGRTKRIKLYEGRTAAYGTTQWNPYNDPNAVFVAGTYVGSDPDPNIRAALIREFGRRR